MDKEFFVKNKKKIIISIVILAIALIGFSLVNSTYSLFYHEEIASNADSYSTGLLSVTAKTKGETISLSNTLPMSDTDGINTTPYTFTIKNVGNLNYKFNVKLLSTSSIATAVDPQYIKIKIDDGNVTTLSSLSNGIIKSDITLAPCESIDISIRIWLSSNTPNSQIGKVFNSKIVTDGQAVYTSTNYEIGSISCPDEGTAEISSPTIALSDKVNITYNIANINGESYYYFKSTMSGTSNVEVRSCTLNNDIFTCNNDSSTVITNDTWYKSSSTNIGITYSTSGTGTVEARTYDENNNFNESSKNFSIYKVTFNKGDADKIDGVASNVDKLCLAEGSGSCNITSSSIERVGYTIVGWNTDGSASTSTWNVGVSKSVNSDGTYYPITKKNTYYAIIRYNTNGGTVTASTTTDSGNVYKWKADSSGLISRTNANGSTYSTDFYKITYGTQTDSDGLVNYSNSKYLKITKTGYSAVTDAEWKCISGCTTSGKTFDQSIAYSSSDFCDAQNGNCTVVLGVNWAVNKYTISYSLGGGSYGTNHPTSASYNSSISISNPTRTGYKFTGWKITGMDSTTHTYGSNTTTSTSISSTTATSFKNLRSTSGTVTFTAQWKDTTAPTISMSKSSSTTLCKGATVKLTCSDSGSGMKQAYMNDNGTVTTGTSTTSQSFNTTRDGNLSTYVKCTDNAGNVSSKTYYYTVVYKYSCKCPYCPSGYTDNGSRCYKRTTSYTSCKPCSDYNDSLGSCSNDYCVAFKSLQTEECMAKGQKNGCHSCPSGYSIVSSFSSSISQSKACSKTTTSYQDFSYRTSYSSSSCSSSCTQTTRSCSS